MILSVAGYYFKLMFALNTIKVLRMVYRRKIANNEDRRPNLVLCYEFAVGAFFAAFDLYSVVMSPFRYLPCCLPSSRCAVFVMGSYQL